MSGQGICELVPIQCVLHAQFHHSEAWTASGKGGCRTRTATNTHSSSLPATLCCTPYGVYKQTHQHQQPTVGGANNPRSSIKLRLDRDKHICSCETGIYVHIYRVTLDPLHFSLTQHDKCYCRSMRHPMPQRHHFEMQSFSPLISSAKEVRDSHGRRCTARNHGDLAASLATDQLN